MTILTLSHLRPSSCLQSMPNTIIYVGLIENQLFLGKMSTQKTSRKKSIDRKRSQWTAVDSYLVKLFRCLLDVCRSSSVDVISIERFLPRGIIYSNRISRIYTKALVSYLANLANLFTFWLFVIFIVLLLYSNE